MTSPKASSPCGNVEEKKDHTAAVATLIAPPSTFHLHQSSGLHDLKHFLDLIVQRLRLAPGQDVPDACQEHVAPAPGACEVVSDEIRILQRGRHGISLPQYEIRPLQKLITAFRLHPQRYCSVSYGGPVCAVCGVVCGVRLDCSVVRWAEFLTLVPR